MDDIVPAAAGGIPGSLGQEADAVRGYAAASHAASTRLIYDADWKRFQTWCAACGERPLPADPGAVARFCAGEAEAGRAPSTITRRLAAIGWVHKLAGHTPRSTPTVAGRSPRSWPASGDRAPCRRYKKRRPMPMCCGTCCAPAPVTGCAPCGRARARHRLCRRVPALGAGRPPCRGYPPRCRRHPGGDPAIEGRPGRRGGGGGYPHGDRLRPVAALNAWLAVSRVAEGYVFRRIRRAGQVTDEPMNDRAVARLVQAVAKAAGYDPALFGGHSLRAGFITSAARTGASIFKIQEISRHRSLQVLAGYVRDAQVYRDHAGSGFL